MDVIGVGFGRTGTASLKQALEILDHGPTYHTREIFRNPDRMAHWEAAVAGQEMNWDDVFTGYRSTVDWPAAAFWRDLVKTYPEAKVILTVRDPRRWHRSAMRSIFLVYRTDPVSRFLLALIRVPLRFADPRLRNFNQVFDKVFRRHFGDGPINDENYAVEVFERHVQEVVDTVPADRLLVYRVEEGWPTLCKFLGIGIPIRAFPHNNDLREFQRKSGGFVLRGLARMISAPVRALRRRRSATADSAEPAELAR